jgi:hypothetical protein
MSLNERTGWRDEELSRRHRTWGYDLPAVDLDFVLLEYDHSVPVALIEHKHELAAPVDFNSPNIAALRSLADGARLKAFVVRYGASLDWYRVRPLNEQAKVIVPDEVRLNEAEYVRFLYRLRGRECPPAWNT